MCLTSLSAVSKRVKSLSILMLLAAAGSVPLMAQGEAELKLPDLSTALFQGVNGRTILMAGLGVSLLGLVFGLLMYKHLRDLPVHESMLEISELIYETCKTYLLTQGKFLMILECFIGVIIVAYFGFFEHFEAISTRYPPIQYHRNRRKLQCCLVRHPCEYIREFKDGVRQPGR